MQAVTKYCLRFSFVFHRVFFRALQSVKLHELGSRSSYSKSSKSIRTSALDQSDFDAAGPAPVPIEWHITMENTN